MTSFREKFNSLPKDRREVIQKKAERKIKEILMEKKGKTLGLYKFYWDCGRQGDLEGVFLAFDTEVQALVHKQVHFGEALGKHSDIYGTIDEGDITLITEEQKVVEVIQKYSLESGLNPLDYYLCEECGNVVNVETEVCYSEGCSYNHN